MLPLYGTLSPEVQAAVFAAAKPPGARKIVVATNIAETSVTVPGVRYVIDPGYVKQKAYNPERSMEALVVVPISRVAAQQRSPRGHRRPASATGSTRRRAHAMPVETVPEIMR